MDFGYTLPRRLHGSGINGFQARYTTSTSVLEDTVDDHDVDRNFMSSIANSIVFDRQKSSKLVKEYVKSRNVVDIIDSLDPSCGFRTDHVTPPVVQKALEISTICYVCASSGVSLPEEVVIGYCNGFCKILSRMLVDTPGDSLLEASKDISQLSLALGNMLLSAAEYGKIAPVKHVPLSLLGDDLCNPFLDMASGSCINAVAFIAALDGVGQSSSTYNRILEALSKKEMSLELRDFYYTKLWIHFLGTVVPGFRNQLGKGASTFLDNVIMSEHIVEAAVAYAENALFSKMREQKRDVDMNFLTIEPFVYPLVSSSAKELYEPDNPESYFDQGSSTCLREYLKWRSAIAESSGWKVVRVGV
uniref:Uncharacterized protein n=2 Tax=Babesia bovis TaxID=5865 RepID=A7ASL4_BABBO|eukprot:XP_001611101.1 hypothetical protein [Babesia bovis T2Bo]